MLTIMSFVQVASMNIEHLSGASREDRKQSAYALVDHIELAGVDVIALQEIYVTDVLDNGERRNEDLDRVVQLLGEHRQGEWHYIILPNRHSGDKSQLCAVMWNSDRLSLTGQMAIDVEHRNGEYNLWDRKPHAIKFSMLMNIWHRAEDGDWEQQEEQKSFIIVPLHMKSNYGGVTRNRTVRKLEAETLCAKLDAVRQELHDESLILIGDTNILANTEPAIETFTQNGLVDLNNFDAATYWSRQYGEAPFDRAFVASGREEFKYTRQYVMRSSDLAAHDRYLSDHYMIKLSVKLYLDDADSRSTVV